MDRPTYVGLPGATEGSYIQYDVDPLDRVTSTRLYGPGNVLRNEHDYCQFAGKTSQGVAGENRPFLR